MSTKVTHSITVTETSTTMPAKFAFNYPVLKTKNGVLKFIELVIGIVCLIIIHGGHVSDIPIEAYESFSFLHICYFSTSLTTSLLLVSYLVSPMTENVLPRTIYELLSNVAAFFFFTMTAMAYLILMAEEHREYPDVHQNSIIVSVLGIISGLLYFISSYLSFNTFRSM